MRKYLAIFILLSLMFPACIHKKGTGKSAKKVQKYENESRSGTYDEDLGAFVLEDDADYDLFEEAEAKKDAKKEMHLPSQSPSSSAAPADSSHVIDDEENYLVKSLNRVP